MARPKKDINEEQVKQLAAINCSYEEMAAVLDCDQKTLSNRFSQLIQNGRATGRMSLKRKQWEMAMQGNITMLIWLGKIMLGQKEVRVTELTGQDGGPVQVQEEPKAVAELKDLIKALSSGTTTKSKDPR